MAMRYEIGTPFTATTTIQSVLTIPYVNSFFVVNDGSNAITYTIYGSPDGVKTGDKDNVGNVYSAAEIAKHWVSVDTGSITSNKSINVASSPYKYFRIDVSTTSGSSAGRIWTNTITKIIGIGGSATNDKGYFATPTALTTAYPTSTNGASAIVGSTGTFWIWKDTAWVDTNQASTGKVISGTVVSYSNLPAANTHTDELWLVKTTTGILFARKEKGIYLSDGSTWTWASDYQILYDDSSTTFYDDGNNTKRAMFQLSGISPNTTRVLTFPDKDFTIAGTDDVALKVTANAAISGATKTKITYDANGLVISGADATASDVGADPTGSAASAESNAKAASIPRTVNVQSIDETGAADNELVMFNITSKKLITSDKKSSDFQNALPDGTTTTVLHGNAIGAPSYGPVVEADITLAANTTNNVSTTKHGFAPVLPNVATQYLNGQGNWVSISSASSAYLSQGFNTQTSVTVNHNLGSYPVTQIIDSNGAVLIPLTITNTSISSLTVTFDVATTGTILCTIGSPALNTFTTINDNYTTNANDHYLRLTASGKTVTLITAVGRPGYIIVLKNASSGDVTLNCDGAETIDGIASITLATLDAITVVSNGAGYDII
jgi:hypothetical protein